MYTPSADSATVPSAPVSPSRCEMTVASSTGVAVTSHTRWPARRCPWASSRVPSQTRSAMVSSKISSLRLMMSVTLCPATKVSAAWRRALMCSEFSAPRSRKYTWPQATRARSRGPNMSRAASPRAK